MLNKPLKIFVDAHCFDNEFQGTQTFVKGLYSELVQNENLDIFFGCAEPGRLITAIPGVDPAKVSTYKKMKNSAWRLAIEIPGILNSNRFDFAHFQYVSPVISNNTRLIITLHDNLFDEFKKEFSFLYRQKRNFLFSRSIQRAAIKTTVSAYSQQQISKSYKIPENQIHIIPNAVSNKFGNSFQDKKDAQNFISKKYQIENFLLLVSRIEPRKNQLLLLDTYLGLNLFRQNISLVFIGKESIHVEEFKRRMDSLTPEQKSHVRWIEQVDQDDLEAFYRACRLFVYPSKAEGFGIPPLEAAICKAPVLCSNATAMKAFRFFNPYMFDPADKEAFQTKLHYLVNNEPEENFLNDVAAAACENYSWKKSAGLFTQLILPANKNTATVSNNILQGEIC